MSERIAHLKKRIEVTLYKTKKAKTLKHRLRLHKRFQGLVRAYQKEIKSDESNRDGQTKDDAQ